MSTYLKIEKSVLVIDISYLESQKCWHFFPVTLHPFRVIKHWLISWSLWAVSTRVEARDKISAEEEEEGDVEEGEIEDDKGVETTSKTKHRKRNKLSNTERKRLKKQQAKLTEVRYTLMYLWASFWAFSIQVFITHCLSRFQCICVNRKGNIFWVRTPHIRKNWIVF